MHDPLGIFSKYRSEVRIYFPYQHQEKESKKISQETNNLCNFFEQSAIYYWGEINKMEGRSYMGFY
jgi:hypothetical protein